MLQSGGGSVVNTSSTVGLTGQINISPYTFAKAGVIGLTRSAAIEYADRNIRVNAIAPTVVCAPLMERFANEAPDPVAMRAAMEAFNPMPGYLRPRTSLRWWRSWPRTRPGGSPDTRSRSTADT